MPTAEAPEVAATKDELAAKRQGATTAKEAIGVSSALGSQARAMRRRMGTAFRRVIPTYLRALCLLRIPGQFLSEHPLRVKDESDARVIRRRP